MTPDPRTRNSIFAVNLPIVRSAFTFLAVMMSLPTAQAQSLTILHSFNAGADGSTPFAGVTLDRAGNFYGTAEGADSGHPSTVFKMSHVGSGWILNTLYTFNHPNDPTHVYAGVVFGPDGALYGTSYDGGQFNLGTVYSLRPPATVCRSVSCPWTLTVLYNFDGLDGTHPYLGNLVFDPAGNIYGTTWGGGAHTRGAVFKLTKTGSSWAESVLYSFTGGSDGGTPYSSVALDSAGNIYGAATSGGSSGVGTVYELSPSGGGWTETTLYTFTGADDGALPVGSVAVDAQGNLFGTTSAGEEVAGVVWKLSPSAGGWVFTVLHAFSGHDGPFATPTLDAAGNVYGSSRFTGQGFGEIFTLTPSGGGYNYTSYEFDGFNVRTPSGTVAVDANGNLYGTTPEGGTEGWGTVWEITP